MNNELRNRLIEIAKSECMTFYGEIARIIGIDAIEGDADVKRIADELDLISRYEHANGRPLLSAVVVNKTEMIPGNGFYSMARDLGLLSGHDRDTFFVMELSKVHKYWTKLN